MNIQEIDAYNPTRYSFCNWTQLSRILYEAAATTDHANAPSIDEIVAMNQEALAKKRESHNWTGCELEYHNFGSVISSPECGSAVLHMRWDQKIYIFWQEEVGWKVKSVEYNSRFPKPLHHYERDDTKTKVHLKVRVVNPTLETFSHLKREDLLPMKVIVNDRHFGPCSGYYGQPMEELLDALSK